MIENTININRKNCDYVFSNIDRKMFSEKNKKTMILYSYKGDVLLNNYLRNNKKVNKFILDYFNKEYYTTFQYMTNIFKNDDIIYVQSYIESFYESLRECFKAKLKKNIIVYRGLTTIPNINVGDIIENNFFVSTSCDIKVAEKFTNIDTYFHIEIPAGTYFCPIYISSRYSEEHEILLNNNSCFYVKSIKDNIFNLILIDSKNQDFYDYDSVNDEVILHKKIKFEEIDKTLIPFI
jgi:hypothetical protein